MKILVLGATGKAGRAAIASLFSLRGIERIYLADHDADALCKLAADLGSLPVSPRYLDAESDRSLRDRMSEADLVLGCLGPFHRYEERIVRAAIAMRRDYLSLCDDPGAVEETLAMKDDAESQGVRVLSGCGVAPGLSNLISSWAASRLDELENLDLAWYLEAGFNLGTATLEHLLQSFAGRAPEFRGGGAVNTRAGSWEEIVEFPPPVGWQAVNNLGHPEPLTLPFSFQGILDIRFKAGLGGRGRSLAMHSLARLAEGEKNELWLASLRAAARWVTRWGENTSPTAVRAVAAGTRSGLPMKRIICIVGDYYRLSGLTMAAAVDALVTCAWPAGIYPPEGILDNRAVFKWLHNAGARFLIGEEGVAGGLEGAGFQAA